jgi:hypothetical protein
MRFRRAWKGTGCGRCHPAGLRFSLSRLRQRCVYIPTAGIIAFEAEEVRDRWEMWEFAFSPDRISSLRASTEASGIRYSLFAVTRISYSNSFLSPYLKLRFNEGCMGDKRRGLGLSAKCLRLAHMCFLQQVACRDACRDTWRLWLVLETGFHSDRSR